MEHPYPRNLFYDGSVVDFSSVGRSLYHPNMSSIAGYLYNNFYVNNLLKIYIIAVFFFFMPIVALIDFSMNNMMMT